MASKLITTRLIPDSLQISRVSVRRQLLQRLLRPHLRCEEEALTQATRSTLDCYAAMMEGWSTGALETIYVGANFGISHPCYPHPPSQHLFGAAAPTPCMTPLAYLASMVYHYASPSLPAPHLPLHAPTLRRFPLYAVACSPAPQAHTANATESTPPNCTPLHRRPAFLRVVQRQRLSLTNPR